MVGILLLIQVRSFSGIAHILAVFHFFTTVLKFECGTFRLQL